MTKGVLLLALGYPEYGMWASQLASSIKANAPDIQITLACSEMGKRDISPDFGKYIDTFIDVPEEYYHIDNRAVYLKAKTYLYDLSPYDETIFLDADMIWLPYKPITELFDKFKDIDFTIICRSDDFIDQAADTLIHWAKGRDILNEYPNVAGKRMYNCFSEFIYFKKCDLIKQFYDLVKSFYLEPKVTYRDFGLQVPDELAYCLAMLHTDVKPHESPFIPIYWESNHYKKLTQEEIYQNYYGYSVGGHVLNSHVKDFYNNLAQMYAQRKGIRFHYPMRNKRDFILERTKI